MTNGKLAIGSQLSHTFFQEGEQLQAVWACPVVDPDQMLDNSCQTKDNYLGTNAELIFGQFR